MLYNSKLLIFEGAKLPIKFMAIQRLLMKVQVPIMAIQVPLMAIQVLLLAIQGPSKTTMCCSYKRIDLFLPKKTAICWVFSPYYMLFGNLMNSDIIFSMILLITFWFQTFCLVNWFGRYGLLGIYQFDLIHLICCFQSARPLGQADSCY